MRHWDKRRTIECSWAQSLFHDKMEPAPESARRRRARFRERNSDAFHIGALAPTPAKDFIEIHHHAMSFFPSFATSIIDAGNDDAQLLLKVWKEAQVEIEKRLKRTDSDQLKQNIDLYGLDCVTAALVYSLDDPPIYQYFNDGTRWFSNQGLLNFSWQLFAPNSSLYKHIIYIRLYEHLSTMESKVPTLPQGTVLYRGCDIKFQAKVGQTVSLCNFTSTSVDRNMVHEFEEDFENVEVDGAEGSVPNKSTIFIFKGVLHGVPMEAMSYIPQENEVLLFPYQTFMVKGIEEKDSGTEITLRSRTSEAIDLFYQIEQFMPNEPKLSPNGSYFLNSDPRDRADTFMLKCSDLDRSDYTRPPEPPYVAGLPEYHILRTQVVSETRYGFELVESLTVLNYYAVKERFTNNQPVYVKMWLEEDGTILNDSATMRPLSRETLQEVLNIIDKSRAEYADMSQTDRQSMRDKMIDALPKSSEEYSNEFPTKFTTFMITGKFHPEHVDIITSMFPENVQKDVTVCQLVDRSGKKSAYSPLYRISRMKKYNVFTLVVAIIEFYILAVPNQLFHALNICLLAISGGFAYNSSGLEFLYWPYLWFFMSLTFVIYVYWAKLYYRKHSKEIYSFADNNFPKFCTQCAETHTFTGRCTRNKYST